MLAANGVARLALHLLLLDDEPPPDLGGSLPYMPGQVCSGRSSEMDLHENLTSRTASRECCSTQFSCWRRS